MIQELQDIGVTDTREIIKSIFEKYKYDLKNMATTSFMHRIQLFMYNQTITEVDTLIKRITSDKQFFDIFISELVVETTEMFRDPSLWRFLRDELLKQDINQDSDYKIWMPEVISGDELFTLCIVLQEIKLLDKVTIICNYPTEINLIKLKEESFEPKKLEISEQNYIRYKGTETFSKYLIYKDKLIFRDTKLIQNVRFYQQNITFDNSPTNINLIIYRNKAIYYNQKYKEQIIATMHQCLKKGGYLILGILEKTNNNNSDDKFIVFNENESIYRKRIM